jgi:hypothetical protein
MDEVPMFVNVSGMIAVNPPRLHSGVAVADLDADGQNEFVVAGFGGPNRILQWFGGQLRDIAPPLLADNGQYAAGLAAGDIDGDGREELYVVNVDAGSTSDRAYDRLFKAQPDGNWADLLAKEVNRSIRNRAVGRGAAAIDRRGVGRYGFVVANHDRPLRLYELGHDGSLANLASPLGLGLVSKSRGILALPISADRPDIVCVVEDGPNLVFRNRGDGTFEECAARIGLMDAGEQGRAIAAVDVLTGKLGLCFGNWEGPHRLMARSPEDIWKDRATSGLAFPSALQTLIAADFDNDGNDELFFNNSGESNRLFRIEARMGSELNGQEIVMLDPGEALDPEGFGTGAAVCDIDGDGILELLIARGGREPQPIGIFKARSAEANDWLRICPLTRFGAPARGAVVRMEALGRVRVKGVCGGSGYRCQMEPVAHFGLGPNGRAGRVHVTWPDGASVVLIDPGANRTITVPYPRG